MNPTDIAKSWVVGRNDRGESVAILYTPNGVLWQRGSEAEALIKQISPTQPPTKGQAAGSGSSEGLSQVLGIASQVASAVSAPISLATQVIGCVTDILRWWEARQQRLMDDARFEEERRIPWTYEMMQRWVMAHKGGGHLDLEISYYLAREAMATLKSLAGNDKMGIPQALLYDLDQIRKTMASMRQLLGQQCELLSTLKVPGSPDFVLIGSESPNWPTPDFGLIRSIASDPALQWDEAVRTQKAQDFDKELSEMMRHPDKLFEKLFGTARIDPALLSTAISGPARIGATLGRLGVISVASTIPGGLVLATAAPFLYAGFVNIQNAKEAVRRDEFRELILFSAEVARVRVLHRIWMLLEQVYAERLGCEILVLEQHGSLCLAAVKRQGSVLTEGEPTLAEPLPSALVNQGRA